MKKAQWVGGRGLPPVTCAVRVSGDLEARQLCAATCQAISGSAVRRAAGLWHCASSSGAVGDPKGSKQRDQQSRSRSGPRAIPKVLIQRQSSGCHTVALSSGIVNLEHHLGTGGRQPPYAYVRNGPSGSSKAHTAPLQRHICAWLGALVLRDAETEDVRVEVHSGVRIVRKISTRSVTSITGWLHTVASLFAAEGRWLWLRAAEPRSAWFAPLAIDLLAASMSGATRRGSG